MRIWLLLSLLLIGCANKDQKCGNKVLTLWPTSPGQYSFQEITLTTLSSPYELSGGAAKIYFESIFSGSGYQGSVAQPRYTKSGDTCVPMDAQSSVAVAVYAQFESLLNFEKRMGTADLLSWPRKVGIDIHVRSIDNTTHNNAHYISGDKIAVLPFSLPGLPLGLNQGIIAHEHFHGHFQAGVVNLVNAGLAALSPDFKPTVEDVEGADLASARGLNTLVLRAWNEGLADVYGAIYTGNPSFSSESLPSLAISRTLDAPLEPFLALNRFVGQAMRARQPRQMVQETYNQGTVLARLMYKLSQSGTEAPEEFLSRIIHRLKDIAPAIVKTYDTQILKFEDIVPILLKDFPLQRSSCRDLGIVLSRDLIVKGFAQCTGV